MRLIWVLLLGLIFAGSADARTADGNHIVSNLVAESMVPAAGARVTLAIVMKPAPQWHGYWKNPGDAGLQTRAAWTAPSGLLFGPLQYPVPQTLLIAGLMNYVYESDYAHLVSLAVPAGLARGTKLPLSVKLDWLACNPQVCVPETATLDIALTVGDGSIAPATRAQFDRWRSALPKPLGARGRFAVKDGRFRLEVPFPKDAALDQPYFFPLTPDLIDYAAPQTATREGDRLVIETAAKAGSPTQVDGVVRVGAGTGLLLAAAPGSVADIRAAGGVGTMLAALGGAFLGGLLLNIMPCVFPILSLKALALARAGGTERQARAEALAYTAGVILICAALGAALLAIRAAGGLAGWAFQLQDARVIGALMLLVAAIGLNLAGLFELPVLSGGGRLAGAGGLSGAFWTGALAAFVATPCTGPFMGAALGAALLLPAAGALAIFVGLGLGLAFPFLLLGFVPGLRRRLPKPGAWMDTFRHILSVPMLVTALGLAWILGRQAGVNAMATGLAAALALALGLWWTGARQAASKAGAWWPALAACLLAISFVVAVPRDGAVAAVVDVGSERFDATKLADLRREGKPVFLYFTADWCLTCKVNEAAAIDRPDVTAAFKRKQIVTMAGDWTRGDPAISRFLSEHGRSGVPLYLFYPAGGGDPRELPQILTPGLLTSLG